MFPDFRRLSSEPQKTLYNCFHRVTRSVIWSSCVKLVRCLFNDLFMIYKALINDSLMMVVPFIFVGAFLYSLLIFVEQQCTYIHMQRVESITFSGILCDALACKISNVTYQFATRQRGEHKPNRRRPSLLVFPSLPGQKKKWERFRSDGGARRIVFSDVLWAPPFPTVTVTEAFWDRLWPRLAGLEGVSAVSPGTSWHRVPTRNAAAAA